MNIRFAIILLLTIFTISKAQVVVTVPEYATQYDSIKIIFDATQGNQGLMGYTGTVYAHTGVITNYSTGSTDWKHVIGTWGNNNTQPALTRLGPNLYELVIGFPRQFYSVTDPNENILKLAFVFRSANGQQTGRDVGGADIFAQLYQSGLNLVVNSPDVSVRFGIPERSPAFVERNGNIDISISAVEIQTKLSTLTLYVDNNQVAQTSSTDLVYNFNASSFDVGFHSIKAVGIDTSGSADSTSFYLMVNPVQVSQAPPAGTDYGINYNSVVSVTLLLYAPYKDFVYVIGDFNNWEVDTSYFMKRYDLGPDKTIWWTTINSISPSTEYAFQYLVDGQLRIADPYTEKILDPWNDQYISGTTYPNLKPYPAGKTEDIVSIFQTAQPQYNWQVNNFQRPAKTDLIVYELLIRDFLSTHSYQTLKDTLNYLKTLGVNAIELMPVMEFSGNESWGYNPIFHAAPDKYYGTKNALKAFIDKAHELGIAVVLDIALNHIDNPSPLARLYWDSANNRPAANNPWLNPVPKHPFNVFNDFNHESLATQYYVDRVNKYWLTEFKIDGFRFDLSKGFTQFNSGGDVNLWGQYDQSRINLLKRMADKIWEVDSTAYVILEHFAVNSEETVLSNYGMMLWGNMNYQYNEATMGYASDLTGASYKSRGWSQPNLIAYMESHDEERLMYKNLKYGNSSGSYNIKDIRVALNRIKLAGAFFFPIPGPKMLWQFGELGYDISIDNPCRTCNKPILWNYYNELRRLKVYKVFSNLINLKKEYDVFRTTNFQMSVNQFPKRINLFDPSMDVTIIGNFGVSTNSINPNFSKTGWWYDYFSGDSLNVLDTQQPIVLEPGEFFIYSTVKLPTPEAGLLVSAEPIDAGLISEFYLEQNYPNPFNPSTEIVFKVAEPGIVNIKIYDVLGREVKTLLNDFRNNGIYSVVWDGDNNFGERVSSGVYFYRMEAGSYVETKKMMLMK
ncbi:MAG: T9SS type A sorting domain-containing protein [Ignavibacteriaceae bacterium]|nr:T9SS type A sorting domain-containing protein [Ignavibacteriaceae bacterium]